VCVDIDEQSLETLPGSVRETFVALAVEKARLEERVRDLERSREQFVRKLAHDLRTPLSAMIGWARVLKDKQLDEPTRLRALEVIVRNAETQARLLAEIAGDQSRV
jgi:signal transduction histidine kinase